MKYHNKIVLPTILLMAMILIAVVYPTEQRNLRKHPAAKLAIEEVKRRGLGVYSVEGIERYEKSGLMDKSGWHVFVKTRRDAMVGIFVHDDGEIVFLGHQ